MRERAVDDEKRMRDHEAEKNGQQQADRLPHAPKVEEQQHESQRDFQAQLRRANHRREQREQCVDAARHRDRDGQNVIDDQRAAGDQPRVRTQQARGDLVTTAARREQFDNLVVRDRDDEHRGCGQRSKIEPERRMRSEREISLFRSIACRRKPIGAESDPRQKCDERYAVARVLAERIERLPEQRLAQPRRFHGDTSTRASIAQPANANPAFERHFRYRGAINSRARHASLGARSCCKPDGGAKRILSPHVGAIPCRTSEHSRRGHKEPW